MAYSIVIIKNKTKVYYHRKKIKDSNWSPNPGSTWDKEQSALNVYENIKKQKEFLSFAKEVRDTLMVVNMEEPKSKTIPTVAPQIIPETLTFGELEEKLPSTEDIDAFDALSGNAVPGKRRISFPRKPSSKDDEIQMLQDAFFLLSDSNTRYQELLTELTTYDRAQQDILHKIELCDLDAVASSQLFKMLKELRRERRAVKNLISMYQKVREVSSIGTSLEDLAKAANLINNRSYKTRVLHEIF